MMHLGAIKERNRKPTPQPASIHTDSGLDTYLAGRARRYTIMREAVSPMASIDAAPVPEYQRDHAPTFGDMLRAARGR